MPRKPSIKPDPLAQPAHPSRSPDTPVWIALAILLAAAPWVYWKGWPTRDIMNDLQNYTDITPEVQISEIVG